MSVIIRAYRENDREQCRSLWRELTEWHREIYQDPKIGGEHSEGHFDKHLARVGPNRLWVAETGLQVIGLTGLIVENTGEAEIEPLIVSRAFRGKGIGRQLLMEVIDEARNLGVRFLHVRPVARNAETIKFLYRQGFRNLGFIELFMDFSEYPWKKGPTLYGLEFNY